MAAMAAMATLTAVLCTPLFAQTLRLQADPPPYEAAIAVLPDAPTPQNGIQATPSSATPAPPSSTSASPSSSSQETSPTPPPSADPKPADAKQAQHDEAERELKVQEKQRLLGVMPQFQVVMNGQAVPLTGGEKWRLALHSAIDPFYIGWAFVIGGGWGEIEDSNKGYGWGDAGYFKRVGANYADNVNGALIGNALLPQLLHQDPRYFRKGTGPAFKRFLYAAESTVVCHGDNGKNQPNVSNVLGNFISGAISNAYYPADQRGASLTLENGLSVTLFGALGGQILEFGPDLSRLVHRHKSPASAAPTSTPLSSTTPSSPPSPAPPPDSH
jgi:hypothetical protein